MSAVDTMPGRMRTIAGCIDDTSPVSTEALRHYWRNPAPFDAERQVEQAKVNAQFNAVRDAGLRKAGLL